MKIMKSQPHRLPGFHNILKEAFQSKTGLHRHFIRHAQALLNLGSIYNTIMKLRFQAIKPIKGLVAVLLEEIVLTLKYIA